MAGGIGSFLVAALKRHADLRGTLFELPGPSTTKLVRLPSREDLAEMAVAAGSREPAPLAPVHCTPQALPSASASNCPSLHHHERGSAVARQKLANLPEGSRIDIVEGDVFKDALPADHDALIVANTAHVFSVPHNIELMRKMRTGVQLGRRLLLVDLWTDLNHTQPGPAALMSGEFLVISGDGQAYSEQEADTWLGKTGWKKIEKTPLAGPTSLIVAEAI